MNKNFFGQIFNFLLFCGYGAFCWYYSYLKPGYASLNIFLEILKFSAVFLAAAAGSVLIHRLGLVLFARFQGLRILSFQVFFIKVFRDGEKMRVKFAPGIKAPFYGFVRVRLKDAFDTAPAFKKNRRKYSRFLLGGMISGAAAIIAAAIIYVVCFAYRAVFTPAVVASLAVMVTGWYAVCAEFAEDGIRRGGFISYQNSRNAENLAVSLAAQSADEDFDRAFLLTEAQNVLAYRIENGLPLGRDAEAALSVIALYARKRKTELNPVIENYLKQKN